MRSINFDGVTNKIAEHQEQFQTVFVQRNVNDASVNMCFEFSTQELEEISKTGKMWYKQINGTNQMHPVMLSPFKDRIITKDPLTFRVCEKHGQECLKEIVKKDIDGYKCQFCCENGYQLIIKN